MDIINDGKRKVTLKAETDSRWKSSMNIAEQIMSTVEGQNCFLKAFHSEAIQQQMAVEVMRAGFSLDDPAVEKFTPLLQTAYLSGAYAGLAVMLDWVLRGAIDLKEVKIIPVPKEEEPEEKK